MADKMLRVEFSIKDLSSKRTRDSLMARIKKHTCALLNSNGGKLFLRAIDASQQNKIKADDVVRPIEQSFRTVMDTFKVHKHFKILSQTCDHIILDVKGSPVLCTLNYHLFLPTDTQILSIPSGEVETVKRMLIESRIVEITEEKIPNAFVLGRESGLLESKTVQLKKLKSEKSKRTDLADRIINNYVTHYISAFANCSGGCIYFGINNSGIVEGEELLDLNQNKIIEKVENAVSRMTWLEHGEGLKRGKQWDIVFVPTKNADGKLLGSTFVIVITVRPCPGGVFAKEPESYHVVNGKVEMMTLGVWRHMLLKKQEEREVVPLILHGRWSTKKMETQYMRLTERLENLRQLGGWTRIRNITRELKRLPPLSVNAELVSLFQCTAMAYRQKNFDEAKGYLEEFRSKVSFAEDPLIFRVEERYSSAALARSSGNFEESWRIIRDGLQMVDQAPSGLVAAAFYHLAGSLLSILVNDESFIGVKRQYKDFTRRKKEHIDQAKKYCYKALQHVGCVEGFEIAKEELKQRISITLSFLYLGSSISAGPSKGKKEMSITRDDVNCAAEKITDSERSLLTLTGTDMLEYNSCRLQIVRSDLHFRYSQLSSGNAFSQLTESLRFAKGALELSAIKNFEDIKEFCETRIENIQKILDKLKPTQNLEDKSEKEEDERFLMSLQTSDEPLEN